MDTIKIPVTLLARPVPSACIVIIPRAYNLCNAQTKLNALEEIPMTHLVTQVCTLVRTQISVFNAQQVNIALVELSVEIAQLVTYVILGHLPLLQITYVLKTTIACMERELQHLARLAHSALSKEESRAPTALLAKLDRYA